MPNFISRLLLKISWGSAARRDFYELAANFISDGVPVFDAIQEIGKRWEEQKNPKAQVTNSILSALRGQSGKALRFGQAMAVWAPSMEAMAIDAGEQAGDIADGLRMSSRLTGVTSRIRSTILSEMTYPFFLLLMFGAFLLMISYKVIPVFASIMPRERWPSGPKVLGVIADNSMLIYGGSLSVLIALIAVFVLSKKQWTGEIRARFDQFIPPWNIHRQVSGAILMTCFATLIKAGIPFSEVIAKLMITSSAWDAWHLDAMKGKMRRGMRDGDAMAGRLFDDDVRWEIGVYGRLTSFSVALESLSERVTERVIKKIQAIATIIRVGIMVLIATMIVWVYGSFFEITMAARSAMQ